MGMGSASYLAECAYAQGRHPRQWRNHDFWGAGTCRVRANTFVFLTFKPQSSIARYFSPMGSPNFLIIFF